MTLFSWLLVGHLVGDFVLQTRWMAINKVKKWQPLLAHSLVYTASVTLLALLEGGLKLLAIILILVSHILMDNLKFVRFWARHVNGADDQPWLMIMLDQSWHIIILAIAAVL